MTTKNELTEEVKSTFSTLWVTQNTNSVPIPSDLKLDANNAKHLGSATVLYADLDGSTAMVDSLPWELSAEVYKTFLRCASKIIRLVGGTITAYDGDRVMAIFTGDSKNSDAAKCALQINYAIQMIVQPAFETQYPHRNLKIKHVVGIDTSELSAARIGVRGDNDLVWIGRAANHAAKLTNLSGFPTVISKDVYEALNDSSKFSNGVDMWEPTLWPDMNNAIIYRSTYLWKLP
ncbi:adenylate/guanylate cyclase domain-containing protein [Janthinobacterium lividum]|uniref:Adenylate/guanylate cyclase domain-containing protein n=1 Tax=Janthinobacterium lividum TaxID=29581 RepID=A0A5C4NXI8_9BURK|nr:adenylate/guanylate cyclase domain-containing protein [Janthinobacterium lividum]TNC78248.1 adenylate/guanylate cyclase domain-containing protein [Janthinobacterium lividum]